MICKKPLRRGVHALSGAAALALAAAAAAAQPSHTCEFALAGWLGTRIELEEAQVAYRACIEARNTSCTAEQGRVRMLEERLKLLRNYIDGYCRR